MDTLLVTAASTFWGGCVVLLVWAAWTLCRHPRCASDCCGRLSTFSMDLTPEHTSRPLLNDAAFETRS